ncbi:hypothetical protein PROFUN_12326 [Planoprotostelium fungivorum]|uniref:Peptidase M28 domain-containing protein n=1 Tax=Planoprotostelium fungivorum TaxID=1890364 RepID=A0A2P6N7W8_9EUKA|nr:hypothetical protein PROFUN_12326 [Planoprotostelium fungivorum]
MRLEILVLLLALSLTVADDNISCVISDAVSNRTFSHYLRNIAALPGFTNVERLRRAYHIRSAFRKAGLTMHYEETSQEGLTIIGIHKPIDSNEDTPLWLVSAHYDTVANTTGLFDNSAGVAALLETARVLTPALKNFNGTTAEVWFIAWDREEEYSGSWSWISSKSEKDLKRIAGVWNMDSVGSISQQPSGQRVPPGLEQLLPDVYHQIESVRIQRKLAEDSPNVQQNFRPNFLTVITDSRSVVMATIYNQTVARCRIPIRVIAVPLPYPGSTVCGSLIGNFGDFCRSDHAAFWSKGIEAVHITDTADLRNPCYHETCDEWKEMREENWLFLLQMTSSLAQTVFDVATSPSSQPLVPIQNE